MKFKEWLDKIEEVATTKVRPTNLSNVDRSGLYGLAAQYGHSSTQLPISKGFDNKAVASVVAGVGSGIGRELEKSGRVFTAPPNIVKFPDLNQEMVMNGTLPLQIPVYKDEYGKRYEIFSSKNYSGNMFSKVLPFVKDPANDPRVRQIGDDPVTPGKFLSPRAKNVEEMEWAKSFTRTLIHIMIANTMVQKGLDSKYDLRKAKLEIEEEESGNLICVYSFEPKTKAPDRLKNGDF